MSDRVTGTCFCDADGLTIRIPLTTHQEGDALEVCLTVHANAAAAGAIRALVSQTCLDEWRPRESPGREEAPRDAYQPGRVLGELDPVSGKTVEELCRSTGLGRDRVLRVLNELKALDRAHPDRLHRSDALWYAGPAQAPLLTLVETVTRYVRAFPGAETSAVQAACPAWGPDSVRATLSTLASRGVLVRRDGRYYPAEGSA